MQHEEVLEELRNNPAWPDLLEAVLDGNRVAYFLLAAILTPPAEA